MSLVIILIIDQDRVLPFKSESQSPVSAYLDSPMPDQFLLQRVEVPSWDIHSAGAGSAIQGSHPILQFLSVRKVDACF